MESWQFQELLDLTLLFIERKSDLALARQVCHAWHRLISAEWFLCWREARKKLPLSRQRVLVQRLVHTGVFVDADVAWVTAVMSDLCLSVVTTGPGLCIPRDYIVKQPGESIDEYIGRMEWESYDSAAVGFELLCTRDTLVTWSSRKATSSRTDEADASRSYEVLHELAYCVQVHVTVGHVFRSMSSSEPVMLEICRLRQEKSRESDMQTTTSFTIAPHAAQIFLEVMPEPLRSRGVAQVLTALIVAAEERMLLYQRENDYESECMYACQHHGMRGAHNLIRAIQQGLSQPRNGNVDDEDGDGEHAHEHIMRNAKPISVKSTLDWIPSIPPAVPTKSAYHHYGQMVACRLYDWLCPHAMPAGLQLRYVDEDGVEEDEDPRPWLE
mmetsp:Transcript_2611/g.4480  ORF Transcript_2611/g.4480 Transcript_2611/m.4480 type:complete len:384 (+) Transcript_2611:130-1281(+)|eukprot:CAMPEP_0119307076 /NCGR_PEP_ID=MMETSP1333-20130426/7675_1 /TAXON_ID=418940 /ORGANISM="Scyphosphaera apsteinii, Strain RCC1455" /LENGTH=383 /DNA_ID=CAMNT_0007310543 /DNA_START=130 /DNA_END=1281 /DNA_ORIENTATION=-